MLELELELKLELELELEADPTHQWMGWEATNRQRSLGTPYIPRIIATTRLGPRAYPFRGPGPGGT